MICEGDCGSAPRIITSGKVFRHRPYLHEIGAMVVEMAASCVKLAPTLELQRANCANSLCPCKASAEPPFATFGDLAGGSPATLTWFDAGTGFEAPKSSPSAVQALWTMWMTYDKLETTKYWAVNVFIKCRRGGKCWPYYDTSGHVRLPDRGSWIGNFSAYLNQQQVPQGRLDLDLVEKSSGERS